MMKPSSSVPTLIPSPSISTASSGLTSPTSPIFSETLTSPTLSTPSSAIDPQTELYLQQLRDFNVSPDRHFPSADAWSLIAWQACVDMLI